MVLAYVNHETTWQVQQIAYLPPLDLIENSIILSEISYEYTLALVY